VVFFHPIQELLRVITPTAGIAAGHDELTDFLIQTHGRKGAVDPTGIVDAQEFGCFLGGKNASQQQAANAQDHAHDRRMVWLLKWWGGCKFV